MNMLNFESIGLTSDGLRLIVDFMYTGVLKIEPSNVWDILTAADILLLAETRRVILESYLIIMVDLVNVSYKCMRPTYF
jgi:hypothetical protein